MKAHICIGLALMVFACSPPSKKAEKVQSSRIKKDSIFTPYSHEANKYLDFTSPLAINKIAEIENEYFQNYEEGKSKYYGTVWREGAERRRGLGGDATLFETFRTDIGEKGDSMHCTIYAVEALMAGMGENFEKLEASHKRIWKDREHAGWSIGYLLVKEWNWKAYLIIDASSQEFEHCRKAFRRNSAYPVWRQPDIPLEAFLIRGKDDARIRTLLKENEFGWGFSHQGIHTWITRYELLKECNWLGAPGKKYELSPSYLFLKTPFLQYYDYASHVVIFPPKA